MVSVVEVEIVFLPYPSWLDIGQKLSKFALSHMLLFNFNFSLFLSCIFVEIKNKKIKFSLTIHLRDPILHACYKNYRFCYFYNTDEIFVLRVQFFINFIRQVSRNEGLISGNFYFLWKNLDWKILAECGHIIHHLKVLQEYFPILDVLGKCNKLWLHLEKCSFFKK